MAELRALVVGLVEVDAGLHEVVAAKDRQIASQEQRIAELERRLGADSSTSSRPPSSDSPYRRPAGGSSRKSSGRRPGKQPGDPGSTMPLVDDPDEVVTCDPGCCGDCGHDLSGAPVLGVARRQVVEVSPPPRPRVTEYRVVSRACPGCGAKATAAAPASVCARVQYGPGVLARAAELLCAHYLPVGRASRLMRSVLGVSVSSGFMAGVRARAARALESRFLPRVRELLRGAGVLHVDETPGRVEGGLRYVHIAATQYLTAMHTGGRAKTDIDAGQVLPGYTGTIVRDGYAGYAHLIDAHHAWCGAHLIRDLRAIHTADPDTQTWASAMATTLTDANTAAASARATGQTVLDPRVQATIRNHYRGATALGIHTNSARAGPLAADALTLAQRFRTHEDMILRFVADLAVPFTNNQAERDVRPVKIQQRTSGGAWRTLTGLADFAIVQSYLSTATKWGQDHYDVLHQLFTTGAWLPPAAEPC
ncbi:MAG: IS66 family transposase [Pseudonocardiales bacterium]|nr:IS66 family transposase [Pseudonocardiales bacterium]